jgi:ABC-type amino acid transport system permease subunit
MAVNVLGLIYGGAMLVNFAWPRAASNPKPSQTAGLLDFHIGFLNNTPILWTVFLFIVVVGVTYYLAVGRRKEFAPVIAPSADDAPLVAATGPGTATQSEE